MRDVYDDVCSTLLEPAGFTLGLVTDAQFLDYYRQSAEEFLSRSGLAKGVALNAQAYSQAQYQAPDWISDIEAAFSDGAVVRRDFEESIAASNRNWQNQGGTPRSWRQDKMPMKVFSLYPAPIVESSQAPMPPAPPDFGIIAAYVPGGDPTSVTAFVGTMTQANQVGTFVSPGAFFTPAGGSIPNFSRGNVAIIGTLGLFTEDVTLDSEIEHLTDDWAVAIKYGILRRIFGSDGELKDILRERYASARFEELVQLAMAVNGEMATQ